MRYWNYLLIICIVALAAFVLLIGANLGWYYFFIFPVLVISLFVGVYLYKQAEHDKEEQMKRGARFAKEDIDAEKWMKESFAPSVLSYIKVRMWFLIAYSFFFVTIAAFLWSYMSFGLLQALKNLVYTVIMFVLFLSYILLFPHAFAYIEKLLPKKWQTIPLGNWTQAYVFLFPVSYLCYLLFPFDTIASELMGKITSLPIFFVIYCFSFLILYTLVYLYEQIHDEDQRVLEDNMRQLLTEKEIKK